MNRHAKPSSAGPSLCQDRGRGAILSLALVMALAGLTLTATIASAAVPAVSSTRVSAVTTKTAVLEAAVNAEGEATTYHFEYGVADCSANPCSAAPAPDGNVGAGSAPADVLAEINGLSPGTTYHFRVVASNASGVAAGPDRTFTTYAGASPSSSCPNQTFRIGPAANLPNCRAYEMVSPIAKNGGDALASVFANIRASRNQASVAGGKLTYSTSTSFGDQLSARGSNQYMATRGPDGWTTHGINAPLGQSVNEPFVDFTQDIDPQFKLFTPDLSAAWVSDSNKKPLTPDAGAGWANFYKRDNFSESYNALTKGPPNIATAELEQYFFEAQGHSSDFSHVIFAVRGGLTSDAANITESQLYDYSGGALHLVSVMPDGTPVEGSSAAGTVYRFLGNAAHDTSGTVTHSVSDDGSRIFFTAQTGALALLGGPAPLYVRENPAEPQSVIGSGGECLEPNKACTKLISSDPTSHFWAASADGGKVIYSTGGGEPFVEPGSEIVDLYEFDVDTEISTPIAGEAGGVVGTSEDASHIYFTSQEDLAAGAVAGEWNLYLDSDGTKTFIATLAEEDRTGRGEIATGVHSAGGIDSPYSLTHVSRVTPDGSHLAFMSNRSLTGYDNTDAGSGKADMEVYLYDAESADLTCVSCNPTGARPMGRELRPPYVVDVSILNRPTKLWGASWLQSWVYNLYSSRALSNDGSRLFFNSFDALVPGDTNGAQDVYQWEAQGSGDCQKAGGCLSLISTGKSPQKSEFVDATPSGDEVFFETSSSIDPRDPGLIDIYVARVGGGFPVPPTAPDCLGDACQGIPAAPNDPTPASASFRGPGNLKPTKARARCKARVRHAKGNKRLAKHKAAKRCKAVKRGADR